MGFANLPGIRTGSGFKLQSKSLLDVRESLDTIQDRDELVTLNAAPEGLRVYVKETKKIYVYNGTSWTVVGGGNVMVGASEGSDGEAGLVPQPKKEDVNKFLRADGTWALPTVEGGGVGSLTDLGVTATAEELNYMSGVTSSVQTQIDLLDTEKIEIVTSWGSESSPLPTFE